MDSEIRSVLCFPGRTPWLTVASAGKMRHLFSFAHRLWAGCIREPKTGLVLITRVGKNKHKKMLSLSGKIPKP